MKARINRRRGARFDNLHNRLREITSLNIAVRRHDLASPLVLIAPSPEQRRAYRPPRTGQTANVLLLN